MFRAIIRYFRGQNKKEARVQKQFHDKIQTLEKKMIKKKLFKFVYTQIEKKKFQKLH